jgi:type I restriction enzyme R subunit
MPIERHSLFGGRGVGAGERHGEDGVGAEARLVRGAVEFDHGLIEAGLVLRIEADDLEDAPFNQFGGLGKAHDLFGERLGTMLEDLNQALAA